MKNIIKNILNEIEKNGFKAYLVGGFVRDYLLGKESMDVDICTNALPKDLHKMFPNNSNSNLYGGFNLKIKNYNIDITTFRKELKYANRKPTEIVYIDSLEEDIVRRDFTINSICMNSSCEIIDLVNGCDDLNKRIIRMLGNIKERLTEDPLRILRAIRFATILDFDIDSELDKEIMDNYMLVNNLTSDRCKMELNKIFMSKNYNKGLELLKRYNLLDILGLSYDEVSYVSDISGMWAQFNISRNYGFTKQELTNIIKIKEILNIGVINNKILYKYGLYCSIVAGEILNINKKTILKRYNKLDIKSMNDLQISNKEIIELLDIEPGKIISDVKKDIVNEILNGKLKNRNNDIRKYILKRKE